MYLLRALIVWLIIIVAESIHGIIRQMFIAPKIGDHSARQIAVLSGTILIFAITWLFIKWIDAPNRKSLIGIGFMWVFLTVLFEFILGIFVFDFTLERLLEDYNITRGGLLGIGLLLMMLTPLLASRTSRSN